MKNKRKQLKKRKNLVNYGWILKIVLLSFLISVFFSFISEKAVPNLNIIMGIILTFVFIFLGVMFDMIGIAVTAADEAKFNSMAAKKIRGAALAVRMKKNADKVSSFCQDVIGDICGIVSGSTATAISLKIMSEFNTDAIIITLVIMGIVSALTIGGKAIEKSIALNKSNEILYRFAYIMSFVVGSDK